MSVCVFSMMYGFHSEIHLIMSGLDRGNMVRLKSEWVWHIQAHSAGLRRECLTVASVFVGFLFMWYTCSSSREESSIDFQILLDQFLPA